MIADHHFAAVASSRAARPSPRRSRALAAEAVIAWAGEHARILSQSERAWASATFTGSRLSLTLAFAGDDGIAAAERFIAELPDHEFAIPGQLVADAGIVAVDHTTLPEPRLTLEAELLLLDDA